MHIIDGVIFGLYMLGVLGIGYYFMHDHDTADDYYLAGRDMSSGHIGLSVVATDVGGGFSIGLGGLGFMMGLSGSWMLFTGLLGAWISAVVLIPRVKALGEAEHYSTFPALFNHFYGPTAALLAGIISALGYAGFTSSQILAGAKLATATFEPLSLTTALIAMGIIVVVYTGMGGMKAVIYTDTVQWIILMSGLIFIGLPLSYVAVGGYAGITAAVDPSMLSLTDVTPVRLINWGVTILPIWFVGMTLYQRIYAARDTQTAQRAWYLAGLFEWPVMAFMGVTLGLFGRVAAEQGMFAPMGYPSAAVMDAEMGLPLLLRTVLPVGLLGLMLSAYFSAIMSTADSCLVAASGNLTSDIIDAFLPSETHAQAVQRSQWATVGLGSAALVLALSMENVLNLMLKSYAFMVSGLLVPLLGALFTSWGTRAGAIGAMLVGGTTTVALGASGWALPWGLDANAFGIAAAAAVYSAVSLGWPQPAHPTEAA